MSTTTFPARGSFEERKSQTVRNAAEISSATSKKSTPLQAQGSAWSKFASHMATWATGGRMALSE